MRQMVICTGYFGVFWIRLCQLLARTTFAMGLMRFSPVRVSFINRLVRNRFMDVRYFINHSVSRISVRYSMCSISGIMASKQRGVFHLRVPSPIDGDDSVVYRSLTFVFA